MESNGVVLAAKTREKRERQPNWTEAEKQLLLSLTRMHQVILENKGSDTMTIKRKSEAWDEIATNMKAAGYQRSKERLKQQLGRIRAAEAKKVKDALAKGLTATPTVIASCSAQSISRHDSLLCDDLSVRKRSCKSAPITPSAERQSEHSMPTPLLDEIEIKIEKATSLDEYDSSPRKEPMLKLQAQPFVMTATTAGGVASEKRDLSQGPFFTLHPLGMGSSGVADGETELEQQMPSSSPNNKGRSECRQRKRKYRLHFNGRAPYSRVQRVRQLHLYRVAVQKERLRTLRLQQCRDRVLYRKDMQIQNLKLQILRNLANHNNLANHINL